MADGLGLIIVGIVLAVIGYLLNKLTTGLLKTLGYIGLVVGAVIAFIGFVILLVGLVA